VVAKPVPDGIVGTGTLTSWNGGTAGSLQVIAKSGHFTFVLTDFSTDFTGENLFALADTTVTMSQCGERNLWQVGLNDGDNSVAPTMRFGLPNVVGAWGDPSFFRTFLFMQYPTGQALTRGCQQPIIALATIHWTMPGIYPGLAVHDGGAASGARGTVKTENGAPFSYDTQQGDTWAAIAHRFGITPAELLYLNPIRHPEAEPAIAYAGQVLNLSPANRGDSESRRP
jgi:LysM repeat protein